MASRHRQVKGNWKERWKSLRIGKDMQDQGIGEGPTKKTFVRQG